MTPFEPTTCDYCRRECTVCCREIVLVSQRLLLCQPCYEKWQHRFATSGVATRGESSKEKQ